MKRASDSRIHVSLDRHSVGVLILWILTVAAFVWQTIDFRGATESLMAYRSGLYLQPWRAVTSGFIHQSGPHALFNLVTLWITGVRTCRRFGAAWFFFVFFVSLFVGQISHTMISRSQVVGISGGVCGLYGFLLLKEWQGSVIPTLRYWSFFWVYPLALLLLFILDAIGLLGFANVNHLAGIATGWLLAFATGPAWRKIPIALITIASLLLVAVRPWDPVWQSVHGRFAQSSLLPATNCGHAIGPPTDIVMQAPALQVTILNPRRQRLVVSYWSTHWPLRAKPEASVR